MMDVKVFKRLKTAQKEIDWEAVYTVNLPKVYNFFRYQTGDEALAEDLTATTFEKAWRKRRKYRHELAEVSTWLFSIARNTLHDHHRLHRQEMDLEGINNTSGQRTTETTVETRFELSWLNHHLSKLPDRERELITLKYGAGLTNRAISNLTELSETNVGTILHRAVHKLRAAWEKNNER